MSWTVLLVLALGTVAMKAIGPLLRDQLSLPAWLEESVGVLPLVIYPALVASAIFSPSDGTSVDERLISAGAVLALLLLVRKKNMFGAAMVVGAAVTALAHFLAR